MQPMLCVRVRDTCACDLCVCAVCARACVYARARVRALRCVPCAWPWLEARLSAFLTDFFLAPVEDSAIEPAMEPRREEGARGEEGASDRGEEGASDRGEEAASDRGEEGASDWARAGTWKA